MKDFETLLRVMTREASIGSFVKKNIKRATSPSSWLRGAGKVAGVLKDPYNPKGAERLSSTFTKLGDLLKSDPSKSWSDTDAPSTNGKNVKSKNIIPRKYTERDYFNIVLNNKAFSGKIVKVTRDYIFIKMFKHPQYGSAIVDIRSRKPEIFFYKENIPKGKSKYIDNARANISYNQKKRHWVAVSL